MRAAQACGLAVHIGTLSTRFMDQQKSGRHVPRIQTKFPERVQAARSHVSQVERGGSGTPHAMRDHRELIVEVDVDVLVALAAGKPGGDQRVIDLT